MKKPRLLELFCGTKSIGKEFVKEGFDVITLDFDKQFDPDIQADILDVSVDRLMKYGPFDAVWASPPCNAFSVAVIGRNWNHDHTPKNNTATHGLRVLEHTVALIRALAPKVWWIENPRGKMRKMPVMSDFTRQTVTYCQYGDTRMKPTDIWTNTAWVPRPLCKNGDVCHESAPRGSATGTQGIKGARDRAVIPQELCRELALYAVRQLQPAATTSKTLRIRAKHFTAELPFTKTNGVWVVQNTHWPLDRIFAGVSVEQMPEFLKRQDCDYDWI